VQTPVSLVVSGEEISSGEQMASADQAQAAGTELLHAEPARVEMPAAADVVASALSPGAGATSEPAPLKTLQELSREAADCRLCTLAETRTSVVFGVGDPQADLVLIGEAPGRDEDLRGEPFVGRAGQLLDRMLQAIGLDRKRVYIMNTIKCRPPNNRDPKPDEVQACNLWFEQQLNMLQPKMICLLGRVAAQTVLETDASLGSLRGRWHDYRGVPTWVTYHPAYLLRSPQQKKKSWQDMLVLSNRLRG